MSGDAVNGSGAGEQGALPTSGRAIMVRPVLAALLKRLRLFGGRRLAAFAALAAAGALAEGLGLLLLLPLLRAFGFAGDAAPEAGWELAGVMLAYVLLVAAGGLVVRQRLVTATRLRQAFVNEQRADLHRAILALDWSAFQTLRSSDLTQTLNVDSTRTGLAIDMLATMATTGVAMAASVAVAASLSPWLVAGAVGLGLVAALLSRNLAKRAATIGEAQIRSGREMQAVLQDTMAGLRLIKGFQAAGRQAERFEGLIAEQAALGSAFQADVATRMVLHRVLAAIGIAGVLGASVWGFGMMPSAALVFLLAFARLWQAALSADQSWRTLVNMLPAFDSLERLRGWCAAHAEGEPAAAGPGPALSRDLVLHRVGLRHSQASLPSLSDIDLAIPAGSTTVIIGPSGAGKSTLADLLLGLLAPTGGRIEVDGAALHAADRAAWRAHVGYVPQDAFLFHDTIRANLLMARPGADEEALWQALEGAAAGEMVRALPEGLEMIVGDRGGRLSGGERQRLALARALLRQPSLLVLDEPTSALDPENQTLVRRTLAGLHGRLTMIVITHRAELLDFADQVVRLEGGRRVL